MYTQDLVRVINVLKSDPTDVRVKSYNYVQVCYSAFPCSLIGWLVSYRPQKQLAILLRGPRLTSENFTCCHTESERADNHFCLNLSYYTDTSPTCRERVRGSNQRSPDQESRAPSPTPTPTPHSLVAVYFGCQTGSELW